MIGFAPSLLVYFLQKSGPREERERTGALGLMSSCSAFAVLATIGCVVLWLFSAPRARRHRELHDRGKGKGKRHSSKVLTAVTGAAALKPPTCRVPGISSRAAFTTCARADSKANRTCRGLFADEDSEAPHDSSHALTCLRSRFSWVAFAGDSHMRMLFTSLAAQLSHGLHTVNFSSVGASDAWSAGVSQTYLNLSTKQHYLPQAVCILRRNGSTTHGRGAYVAVVLSGVESRLLKYTPSHTGSIPTLVNGVLRSGSRAGLCLSYSAMLFPDDESIGRIYGTQERLWLPQPDALIVNTAQWPTWKGWSLARFRMGIDMLLSNVTALPGRLRATSLIAAARPPRRVVIWSSSPTAVANLPKHKSNITHGALSKFAGAARDAVLAHAGNGGSHAAFFDVLSYGVAGWHSGQFSISSDALHWNVGGCAHPAMNKFRCSLFKEASGRAVTLYSCLWDATLAFLCGGHTFS